MATTDQKIFHTRSAYKIFSLHVITSKLVCVKKKGSWEVGRCIQIRLSSKQGICSLGADRPLTAGDGLICKLTIVRNRTLIYSGIILLQLIISELAFLYNNRLKYGGFWRHWACDIRQTASCNADSCPPTLLYQILSNFDPILSNILAGHHQVSFTPYLDIFWRHEPV